MSPIERRYRHWERVVREFIRRAEEQRYLGAAETAKALLLYGMNAYENINETFDCDEKRLQFIKDMRTRTASVLEHVRQHETLDSED